MFSKLLTEVDFTWLHMLNLDLLYTEFFISTWTTFRLYCFVSKFWDLVSSFYFGKSSDQIPFADLLKI